MQFWQILLLGSSFLVFYNYAGYAIIAYIGNAIKRPSPQPPASQPFTPRVSFIVAAYNEATIIGEKILNSLAQEYPADALEFILLPMAQAMIRPPSFRNTPP